MTAQHLSSIQPIRRTNRMRYAPVWINAGLVLPLAGLWLTGTPSPAIAQPLSHSVFLAQASEAKTTTTLFVNPVNGNDVTGDGSDRAPFKTITRALDAASANTVIQLAPGTYSHATGETFPIALKPRVTLQGDPATRGQAIVIQGGGNFASPSLGQQNITILGGANQASVVGVTITNPNSNGFGVQIESSSPTITNSTFSGNGRGGIVIVGSSASVIRNNFFSQNGDSLRIQGNARPTVQENVFEQSATGIVVSDLAAPLIVGNRITQNKTGISLDGQAQPQLRSNSVEGNEQFGLVAIAQSRPDLGSASDADVNFFRNNGQKDIALQTQSAPLPAQQLTAPPDNSVPERSESPVPPPSAPPITQQPQNSTTRPDYPDSVVVPVVTAPSIPAVPTIPFGDRAPLPPSSPNILPLQSQGSLPSPKIVPAPVESSTPPPGITSTAFPMPSALSGANRTAETTRPMQVIQLESASEPATTAVRRVLTPPATVPTSVPSASVTPFPAPPVASQEIPAPPRVFPRPSTAPVTSPRLPIGVTPQVPAPLTPLPSVMPLPAKAVALPVPKPDAAAIVAPRPVMIPVPRPESDRVSPVPARTAKPILSPLALPPMANLPTNTNSGNLLPVPNANPPLGNVSGMPKVYSLGSGRQPVSGIPITPENAGFVVVKYRVVVVATDNTQQEQLRAIVPDAFPVVYRGQRVMQAGAFGDRAKADELVASLNTQGLQAIIEPLR